MLILLTTLTTLAGVPQGATDNNDGTYSWPPPRTCR